ncbi:methionyl-tRNA formyltransferase [Nakamurella aerolata]|uniref:methionyl-tRNA formyltransferase n=1 Tax=Nakamurella aerolata TaxID=1656892 RepID=UPI0014884D3F|nr:methionyl-tRNA formyltransferase [Nakamurella aerolata]
MRIVFAGTPDAAVPSLRALLDAHRQGRHQLVAVITRPDAKVGRGRTLQPSPVAAVADEAGIPVIKAANLRGDAIADTIADLTPDAGAVVAYGAILPQRILDIPPHGWTNLHFSLLPAWRGAAPVAAAIRAGEQRTGASTFRLEAGLDTGPVYGTLTEPIGLTDTTGDLLGRLADRGAGLLLETLDALAAGTAHPVSQPDEGVSTVGKLTAADAVVDWTRPAGEIDRLIRAMTPDPGATTGSRWGRLTLGPVTPMDAPPDVQPGQLVVSKRAVVVGTGSGAVRLGTVTAPGKKPMPAADWARGARPTADDLLGQSAAAATDVQT